MATNLANRVEVEDLKKSIARVCREYELAVMLAATAEVLGELLSVSSTEEASVQANLKATKEFLDNQVVQLAQEAV